MPDKSLVEHIKKRVDYGQDIRYIRDQLLKTGFTYSEVHEAIDAAFRGAKKDEELAKLKKRKSPIVGIIRPSRRKFVLPIIVLAMLLLYFWGNVSYLPSVGKKLCIISKMTNSVVGAVGENSTDAFQLQNQLLEQETLLISQFRTLLFFNFPFMITRAYRFNPFFPTACELTEFTYASQCIYYASKQDYNCIKENEEKSREKPIADLLGGIVPEYRKISGPNLFLNSLLLLSQYYVMNCFLVYFYDRVKRRISSKETITWAIIIAIILILTLAVISYIYLLNLISLKFG